MDGWQAAAVWLLYRNNMLYWRFCFTVVECSWAICGSIFTQPDFRGRCWKPCLRCLGVVAMLTDFYSCFLWLACWFVICGSSWLKSSARSHLRGRFSYLRFIITWRRLPGQKTARHALWVIGCAMASGWRDAGARWGHCVIQSPKLVNRSPSAGSKSPSMYRLCFIWDFAATWADCYVCWGRNVPTWWIMLMATNYMIRIFGKQRRVLIAIIAFLCFNTMVYWRDQNTFPTLDLRLRLLFLSGAVLHLSLRSETTRTMVPQACTGKFVRQNCSNMACLFLAGFLGVVSQQGKLNDIQETIIPLGIISGFCRWSGARKRTKTRCA